MLMVRTELRHSPIHGIGLFAAENISQGTLVWKFIPGVDQKLAATDVESLPTFAKEQILKYAYRSKESDVWILCADDARFFNHSDQPNMVDDPMEEGLTIAAREINKGEELTSNYRTYDADFDQRFHACQKPGTSD